MPLGLAKDSMLNLAELASKTDEDVSPKSTGSGNIASRSKTECLGVGYEQKKVNNANEADNDVDAAMEKPVEAPIHSKIFPDEKIDKNNILSPSTDSNYHLPFENKADKEFQQSNVRSNTQQYAGFQADYHDFENYTLYSFPGSDALSSRGGNNKGRKDNPWWQCIFPWISSEGDNVGNEDSSETEDLTQNEEEIPSTKTLDNDDEISMISAGSDNALGEMLSERDRHALLARLRLAQPDLTKDDVAGNGNDADEISAHKKSILKRPSRSRDYHSVSTRSKVSGGNNLTLVQQSQRQRRSLFPAYEPRSAKKENLKVSFSPMARVVTIKSSKDMDSEEKSRIWWQKPDYDEFRKTGRMISKVMLQGGSEIWLATNQSWQLPNQGKAATLRHAIANIDNEDTSDKWWHKFGHSRRGLEHIASVDEGRQRQANVKTSIRAILTEQRRQKTFHREDPEKLRMCSIQYTSWAKDLALASGASDADAVTKNFDDSRKSREFYLLKFSRAGKLDSTSGAKGGAKQVVPAFMKPMISMQLRPNRLDANTTSRLQFKKKEEGKASIVHKRVNSELPSITASGIRGGDSKPSAHVPIHDPAPNVSGRETLASKAAGFANGEKAVNMSAVLTGMGPIPKSPDAAHSRPVMA